MKYTPIARHFDSIAHKYDEYKLQSKTYYNVLKNAVKREIKGSNCTILDIGCGTGEILQFLLPKKGVGTDISSEMVIHAKRKYRHDPSLTFVRHDIEKRPVNGKYDYILCIDVIEHLTDKEKALRNIQLSMDNHSVLILSMANPFWEPMFILMEKLNLKMPEGPHRRISESDLLCFLKKNNLYVVSKKIYLPHISIPFISQFGLIYVYTIMKNSQVS
jgi:2-polyprenyl-3-methyl-5-hydroxy-6-metoxy-1,4-benzoquinol methylase